LHGRFTSLRRFPIDLFPLPAKVAQKALDGDASAASRRCRITAIDGDRIDVQPV
jgi:hypothetical protein